MLDMITKGYDTVLKWQKADPTDPGTWPKGSSPMTTKMETVLVKNAKVGDRLDLFEDRYADPNSENFSLECQYAVVESITPETTECTLIQTSEGAFGFPPEHVLTREVRHK
jgi:hypothetical protein